MLSGLLGTAFDTNPNYDAYDDTIYVAMTNEPEKARHMVEWQNNSPSRLSPHYDSMRSLQNNQTGQWEDKPWKRHFWSAALSSAMDGAGLMVVGFRQDFVDDPDPALPGATPTTAAVVSSPGASASSEFTPDPMQGTQWTTVATDGASRAGIRSFGSTGGPPPPIEIIRRVGAGGAQTILSLDNATYGPFIAARSISPTGDWLLINTQEPTLVSLIWNPGFGLVEFNDWIQNDICVTGATGSFFSPYRIAADAPVIMGRAATPAGFAFFRLRPRTGIDSDDDGIFDIWETNGIDINNDGIIDLDLPAMGADPDRKDLFLEVDAMRNVPWSGTALDMVVQAFAAAPVVNPDFSTGITLHIDRDTIETVQRTGTIDDQFIKFQDLKTDHFGTPDERGDPNWPAIRCAREAVFRYALIVDEIADPSGGLTNGLGERPGNDFMVSGTAAASLGANFDREFAITFMHELGHTLNLRHGGGDDETFKPNYVSVMNYAFRKAADQSSMTGEPTIDYSRESIPAINEVGVSEQSGINSTMSRNIWMPHGSRVPGSPPDIIDGVQLNGAAHDFNHMNGVEPTLVQVDLNWVGNGTVAFNEPTPNGILAGHDDWAAIRLPLDVGGAFARDVATPPNAPTPTLGTLMAFDAAVPAPPPPCVTDLNSDGTTNGADLGLLLGAWGTAQGDLTGDGFTNGADLGLLLGAWGGCP